MTGTGTESDPFVITTLTDLQNMNNDLDAYYVLANDIDASGTAAWNGGEGFVPIGSYATPFQGQFDGKGYTITGLTIARPTTNYIGLFGVIEGTSELPVGINNVTLASVAITGKGTVGALVGKMDVAGSIYNCHSSGAVSGTGSIGGLIGSSWTDDPTRIVWTQCSSSCTVVASSVDAGGLAGDYYGTIRDSYATGDVTAVNYAAGLGNANKHWSSTSGAIASHCFATGNVTATNNFAGGLFGWIDGSASDCYATGAVAGDESYDGSSVGIGGAVGQTEAGATLTRCYSTGTVSGTSSVGGFLGDDGGAVFTDCAWDEDTSGTATACGSGAVSGVTGYTTTEMKDGTATTGWSPVDWDLITASNNGYACLLGLTPGCVLPTTPNVIGDRTVVVERPVLELIRNVEVQLDGRFYVDKNGNAVYESRFHRSG